MSLFLLKNALGSKMKKGFKNSCNGDGSTSTLNQHRIDQGRGGVHPEDEVSRGSQPTLEEMILRLDLEEKMARRAKLDEYGEVHHRMSCVNSSDILRSARNALNQYPRFSLDGKDAMYRSSFRNFDHGTSARKSVGHEKKSGGCLPAKVGGERVVWCKPGVVGRLMGLEAMPMPMRSRCSKEKLDCIVRKQYLRRKVERQVVVVGGGGRRGSRVGSCSMGGPGGGGDSHCVVKPVGVELAKNRSGWPLQGVSLGTKNTCVNK